MRPPTGQPAWVECDFKAPTRISSSSVYFADDRRFCKLPASWRVLYRDGGDWKPIPADYAVDKDRFNTAAFAPVTATAVRLDRKSTRLNSSHLVISYAVF